MARKSKTTGPKQVEALNHTDETRKNIATAEMQAFQRKQEQSDPVPDLRYPRNPDLDPQLVWRGKDDQDAKDLSVRVPPLYIQEKIHPQAIIDNLRKQTAQHEERDAAIPDLFADFNGLPDEEAKLEFYEHDQHWSNRMILGDSLQVMASLAEREALRGKVQCIYFDPPYGIKFNSNWQPSTQSRDVKDGSDAHLTREPEQIKAFRDTWKDGIHSYLSYLRDRLIVARDLLTDSGSIFVQIGDENVHRVRALMDEVFGDENFVTQITVKKSSSATQLYLSSTSDFIIQFAKNFPNLKFRHLRNLRKVGTDGGEAYRQVMSPKYEIVGLNKNAIHSRMMENHSAGLLRLQILTSQRQGRDNSAYGAMSFPYEFDGGVFLPSKGRGWTTTLGGMNRLKKAGRIAKTGSSINYIRYFHDSLAFPMFNIWTDTQSGSGMDKLYVVQSPEKIIQRCILMATDPGDIVLDPTCGSGTTATVAEQWGRRWITIDTSRVALALARQRIMAARYPFYLLSDSAEGAAKEGELTGRPSARDRFKGSVRQGFVYERAPHITLKSIANNAEIDVIWDKWQETLEPLREQLNQALGQAWEEWEIPRDAEAGWDANATNLHGQWWQARIARQTEIDASIARAADVEFLYDRPYEDKGKVRVAGPFTVESLSPHRALALDENDELFDELEASEGLRKKDAQSVAPTDFGEVVLEHLRTSGVHQNTKDGRITFTSVTPWLGDWVFADGRYVEGEGTENEVERRAAVFVGPEFGQVVKNDMTAAAREAMDAGFDILIACGFQFDAHCTELTHMGPLKILKARINPDLHMADSLKNTKTGTSFMVFGEPDISIERMEDDQVRVTIQGMDVFDPTTGAIRTSETKDIATWFIDTAYDRTSFFVRHAYFLGGNDPYGKLKTTLKAEIDEEAWETLYSDVSRPFPIPDSGLVAVKVINHFGDEVMKVFSV